jgi:hypothetical protein
VKPRVVHEGRGGYIALEDARYPIDHVEGGCFAIHFPAGHRARAPQDEHLAALIDLCEREPERWTLETPLATTIVATTIDLVVDDDEGIRSFFAKSAKPRRYLALARGSGDRGVHCELDDQRNGFSSATVRYSIAARIVRFVVSGRERFDAQNAQNAQNAQKRVRLVEVRVPEKIKMSAVQACLGAIFGDRQAR